MINHSDDATIIAQCTAKGPGAIALLRLSGVDALAIASQFARLVNDKIITEVQTHTIHYGSVIDQFGQAIDTVLFLIMRAPHTFTGQDTVEITCHNNQFLIERIIQTAIAYGARIAQNGEFARRAYLNGKIDLLQAEAINELIHANNQLALKQSLAQLDGSFSHWVSTLEKKLDSCLALSEASFEFLDEEMTFGEQIKAQLENIVNMIVQIKSTFDQQKQIRQGMRVAIIGSVNAGKSQLFNALLKQERAIVTPIAGTTRDTIEAGLYRDQNYWSLIDTAGLRNTSDIVEKEGIQRSSQEAKKADLLLVVFDGSKKLSDGELKTYQDLITQFGAKVLVVRNKIDLPQIQSDFATHTISISAKTGQNLDKLEFLIAEKIEKMLNNESPFLLNNRHFNLLLSLEQKLKQIFPLLNNSPAYELISIHLQEALEHVTEFTGKTISEQGMDAVFREFCVGK